MLRLSRQAQMSQQARLHRAPVVTLVVLAMAMVIPRCCPTVMLSLLLPLRAVLLLLWAPCRFWG